MTIVLNIGPDVQAELARRAASQGSRVEEFAASLLTEAVQAPAQPAVLSQARIDTTLREMAIFSHKILALPDAAFTRESFFQLSAPHIMPASQTFR